MIEAQLAADELQHIPFEVSHQGRPVRGTATGAALPGNRSFNLQFEDAPPLIMEAFPKDHSEGYIWNPTSEHPYTDLCDAIGQQIAAFTSKK